MLNERDIALLRQSVKQRLSEKRYVHSLGVEKCAVAIGKLCNIDSPDELSAAALLHDITKELDRAYQFSLIDKGEISLSSIERESEAVLHSYTAPVVIRSDFPRFATQNVLSAVEKHTLGNENMSIFDEIIFLSDYIEEGRSYPSSRELYDFVFSNMKNGELQSNVLVLHKASLSAIDYTITHLIKKGAKIAEKTFLTRNALISKILHS